MVQSITADLYMKRGTLYKQSTFTLTRTDGDHYYISCADKKSGARGAEAGMGFGATRALQAVATSEGRLEFEITTSAGEIWKMRAVMRAEFDMWTTFMKFAPPPSGRALKAATSVHQMAAEL